MVVPEITAHMRIRYFKISKENPKYIINLLFVADNGRSARQTIHGTKLEARRDAAVANEARGRRYENDTQSVKQSDVKCFSVA